MKRNHLKEYYKNKLMQELLFEGNPPTPWQPPTQSQDPQIPRFDPNDSGNPIDFSPFGEADPSESTPSNRPDSGPNPHSPVFRPNGVHPDTWHPIPGTNPPKYYHDLGNGYGQGYRWNPTEGRYEPDSEPTRIPQNYPGYQVNPGMIPVNQGEQHYTDPSGNLYMRDSNGTVYYWDRNTGAWVEITDPTYLPRTPKWITPSGHSPSGLGRYPMFIPNPFYSPLSPGEPGYVAPFGPRPRRPGFGGIIDRFRPYRPLGFPG